MINKTWKRFVRIENLIQMLLIISILTPILTQIFFKFKIPMKIQGYVFFLSLGLFVGFEMSKNEYRRALRKKNEDINSNN